MITSTKIQIHRLKEFKLKENRVQLKIKWRSTCDPNPSQISTQIGPKNQHKSSSKQFLKPPVHHGPATWFTNPLVQSM